MYQEARIILGQAQGALASLNRVGRGETGRVYLSYVASAAFSGVALAAISTFRKNYPGVEFNLIEMEARRQVDRILSGDLDLGIARAPVVVPEGVCVHVVRREPLVAVVCEGHVLSRRKHVQVKELADEPILTIRQPAEIGLHQVTIAACNEAGINATIKPVGTDFTELGTLVGIGMGVCIVAKSFERMQIPGVRFIPLTECETTSDLAIVYRKVERSPAVSNFIAHFQALARSGDFNNL